MRDTGDLKPGDGSATVTPFPLNTAAFAERDASCGADLVSLFRQNNSSYNNMTLFSSPKVSPAAALVTTLQGVDPLINTETEEKCNRIAVESSSTEQRPAMLAEIAGAKQSAPAAKLNASMLRSHFRFNGLSIISPVSLYTGRAPHKEGFEHAIDHWLWDYVYKLWSEGYLKALLLWIIWIAAGTVFYAIRNEMGFAKGFFMTINVGYSIGTGYPREIDRVSLWFSVFNILLGVTALGAGLNAFAHNIINSGKSWYEEAEYAKALVDKKMPIKTKLYIWLVANKYKMCVILVFFGWGSAMTFWASMAFKTWKFPEALYFAVSHLSTGGMYPMPSDSPPHDFIVAGIFMCFGVPLMCLAMGNIAAIFLNFRDPEEAKQIIRRQVTKEEIEMMSEFGIDDGDGYVDRAEFILLCAVRLGAATPELIAEINKRFVTLDIGKRGTLTREELLQVKTLTKGLVMDRRERTNSSDTPR